MSNVIFPKLAGLTFEIQATPSFSTVVQQAKNRSTTRIMNDPYPKWTFELSYELIRSSPQPRPGRQAQNPSNYSELDLLVGFFCARGGSFDSFMLDPGMLTGNKSDWEARGAPVGVGDGSTTTFYLQRDCGGFYDEVQATVGNVFISVRGIVQAPSAWTQGANGAITFSSPPPAGAVITWDGFWMYRVTFPDSIDLKQFSYQMYELQKITLVQDKQ